VSPSRRVPTLLTFRLQSPVLTQVSPRPNYQMTVADASSDQNRYVYRRPSFASTSSSSAHVADRTPVGSTRSLTRMTSSSSVPDITVQAPVITVKFCTGLDLGTNYLPSLVLNRKRPRLRPLQHTGRS
jgi:hypothetical protein